MRKSIFQLLVFSLILVVGAAVFTLRAAESREDNEKTHSKEARMTVVKDLSLIHI